MSDKPAVSIAYCTRCNWLLRASWMAQELLSTFADELGSVTLVPGTNAVFEIHVGPDLVWERKRDGGFPDIRDLKQLIRDRVNPDRDLGHIDHRVATTQEDNT
ncbi:SelT/SelW/SelH family protein [uncultured Amaricoccus sp.]|uniref:SelT/SelW/SelH family protein n=1 Tax=uncultured Amaricoccus sp. TaxID=339341 RepID=UPI0026081BC7|nr:SelT/SelW/SelH family protein [uncultured Amaricoccus sp.]